MKKLNVKKGDQVLVIAGKNKGKISKIESVFPEENKVVVKDVAIASKHHKARKQEDKSKIVKIETPIDASNVMVICPSCNKATRISHGENAKGKKSRICKKCKAALDKNFTKPKKEIKAKETEKDKKDKPASTAAEVKSPKKTETKKETRNVKVEKTAENTRVLKAKSAVNANAGAKIRKTAPKTGK